MQPVRMHDPTVDESASPVRMESPHKKSLTIEKRPPEGLKVEKKSQLYSDNNKSHAMMVQATEKDILSFENVCLLSEKYKFDNKLIYEIHSEFISIRDMQKSMYKVDTLGIPAKLFLKYCTVLKDKTPLVQKRFLRAFGIDYDKAKKNKVNQDDKIKLLKKLQEISDNSNSNETAPDTFVSWQKYLHLNALMKYQKGTKQMFVEMWISFIDPFHQGYVQEDEIRDIFEQLARGRYTKERTLVSTGFSNAVTFLLKSV
jgi:hypothetical protein